jgi:hypothetical protein
MAIKQYIIIVFASVLLACAGTRESSQDGATGGSTGRLDCISTGTIRDYRVLDDANLVVTGNGNRK